MNDVCARFSLARAPWALCFFSFLLLPIAGERAIWLILEVVGEWAIWSDIEMMMMMSNFGERYLTFVSPLFFL